MLDEAYLEFLGEHGCDVSHAISAFMRGHHDKTEFAELVRGYALKSKRFKIEQDRVEHLYMRRTPTGIASFSLTGGRGAFAVTICDLT